MSAHRDDLKTVMHLVRGGSLSSAAAALDVSYTTVARRVKRAEDDLGVQLFDRLVDGYQATEAGEAVARKAAAMETEEMDLLRNLAGAEQVVSGHLTITAPQLLCSTHLIPVFKTFAERYPDVELHVRSDNSLLDLNRREADLAIRVSDAPGDSLTGRILTRQESLTFASKEWLEKLAHDPNHPVSWIIPERLPSSFKKYVPELPSENVVMRSDDMLTMIEAARAGIGVVVLPAFLGRNASDLYELPINDPMPFPEIWAVAHRDVWRSARVAAFREVLLPHFKAHSHLFVA
ncbi:LysR family transcriptional regulator [Cognatishimia maritima]|uniref:Transcriptional regulator, LysR family n=1 Tax=Cognatishimia maritima TaxID=870908 RepID=A0A1M5SQR2_9RHOB|nr:LysR family transcriptional regulator [Cognatishimia maritima]SHH40658.1 transcriptional regulator, LysR family [Cognatishimia maritima]